MKRKLFSILFAPVLVLTLSLVTAAAGDSVPDNVTAITKAADRLVALQSTESLGALNPPDFGWNYYVTDLTEHTGVISGYNMYGVVILGLLDAYEIIGTESYLAAATGMADHMTSGDANNGEFYKQGGEQESAGAYEYQFLMRYAEVSGDLYYSNYAKDLWGWNKVNTDMFASASALNDELLRWAGSDAGAASWMLAAFGAAIHAMGDDTFAYGCADLIAADLDPDTGMGWLVGDHMALAECLEFLSELDSAAYSSTIDSIITALVAAQDADGCWYGGYTSVLQDTVYAVRALAVYGGDSAVNAAQLGAAWLILDQLPNGGWLDDYEDLEYSEQDAEALRALVSVASGVCGVVVNIDIKPGSDQNTITLSSAGLISVAILSSATFDATEVDPATVTLAGGEVKVAGKSDKYLSHERDVNNDGLPDLVCQILTKDWTIEIGATTAVLLAETSDGKWIYGKDTIRIVLDN